MDLIQLMTVAFLTLILLLIIVLTFDPLHMYSHPKLKKQMTAKTKVEDETLRSFAAGEATIHNSALHDSLTSNGSRAKTPEEEAAESFAMGEFAIKEGEENEKDD